MSMQLDDLNEAQRQAVLHQGAPILVVAGAGSGKTRVLTRRIAYLIASGIPANAILAITFTNKAAGEMKERLVDLVGPAAKWMWVSTFHSICVRILRKHCAHLGYKSGFAIYDSADQLRLIKLIANAAGVDVKQVRPQAIANWISNCKNELIDAEDSHIQVHNPNEEKYFEIYCEYQRRLKAANAFDFDDLIMETVRLFKEVPEVLQEYRKRFAHVLVDEYQDTNHAQYMLVKLLCEAHSELPTPELMVVGDSDQSIYAFRGATIRNILDFVKDFPGATEIALEQNYRSTQNILSAANAIIVKNPNRPKKDLWSANGAGEKISGYYAANEVLEANFIAQEISDLIFSHKYRGSEIAVFYRTNAQSRALEQAFRHKGIGYRMVGGTRFYERKEIKDLLAYLKLLINPDDDISVRRILNLPKRGIGARTEAIVAQYASANGISFFSALTKIDDIPMATRAVKEISQFVELIKDLQLLVENNVKASEIIRETAIKSGLIEMLQNSKDPQDESRLENLQELASDAATFEKEQLEALAALEAEDTDAEELAELGILPDPSLYGFLEGVALVADADEIPASAQDLVTFMTLHTAKGLEFPVVFLSGCDEGLFPHERCFSNQEELAEERRLAYVGVTRAEQKLYVTGAADRNIFGQNKAFMVSRFVNDIPEELLEWIHKAGSNRSGWGIPNEFDLPSWTSAVATTEKSEPKTKTIKKQQILELEIGDSVLHPKFGMGQVLALGPGTADIDFGSYGVKRLALRVAPLEKL